MLETVRTRRFAILPMVLALTIFAVGALGFVATAGTPEYSQTATVLPDVVFAMPASDRVSPVAPAATTESAPENSPVVAVLAAATESPAPVPSVAPAPSSPVVAASGASGARAMQGAAPSPEGAAPGNLPVYSPLLEEVAPAQAAANPNPSPTPTLRAGKQIALTEKELASLSHKGAPKAETPGAEALPTQANNASQAGSPGER